MPVRSTMANLITRVRLLTNDPSGASQVFSDQNYQDVLDASRLDVINGPLRPQVTYAGSSIQYLDYFSTFTDWEDDVSFKQYLTNTVVPSLSEPIAGHWQFAQSTLPPVAIYGKTYDLYRAAADILERWAAQWALRYSMTVDGQNLQRGQVVTALQNLATTYRRKQRARSITISRGDMNGGFKGDLLSLAPRPIDYMAIDTSKG